jgi:hypothetical protein
MGALKSINVLSCEDTGILLYIESVSMSLSNKSDF